MWLFICRNSQCTKPDMCNEVSSDLTRQMLVYITSVITMSWMEIWSKGFIILWVKIPHSFLLFVTYSMQPTVWHMLNKRKWADTSTGEWHTHMLGYRNHVNLKFGKTHLELLTVPLKRSHCLWATYAAFS